MKAILLTIVLSILLAGTAIAQDYTFDGEIDPSVFQSWTVMADHSAQEGIYIYATVINPDKSSDIQIAIVVISMVTYYVEAYGYLKGDDVRFFNLADGGYVEYDPPPEAEKVTKTKMIEILETVRGKGV